MKKLMPALCLFITVVISLSPGATAMGAQPTDDPTAALAPAQRDINTALLAVIVGSLLVGYERASHGRRKVRKDPGSTQHMPSRKL